MQYRVSHTPICAIQKEENNLHQQISETMMTYLVVIQTSTMTSFWNMSIASAPIHITDTRVKYWIRADTATQPPY